MPSSSLLLFWVCFSCIILGTQTPRKIPQQQHLIVAGKGHNTSTSTPISNYVQEEETGSDGFIPFALRPLTQLCATFQFNTFFKLVKVFRSIGVVKMKWLKNLKFLQLLLVPTVLWELKLLRRLGVVKCPKLLKLFKLVKLRKVVKYGRLLSSVVTTCVSPTSCMCAEVVGWEVMRLVKSLKVLAVFPKFKRLKCLRVLHLLTLVRVW
eukprot:PhF_6_TR5114/c0_g1_i2/m.7219